MCLKHGYHYPEGGDLMKEYVSSQNNVVCLFFFPLKSHHKVNLVALAYNVHFTGIRGKAEEMAFVLLKDQFSLKIGVVSQERE